MDGQYDDLYLFMVDIQLTEFIQFIMQRLDYCSHSVKGIFTHRHRRSPRMVGLAPGDNLVIDHPQNSFNHPDILFFSLQHRSLFNMKFNPSAIEGKAGAEKFIMLNDIYFNLGGYHVQYNIVDRNMLIDAQKKPENYTDLMVRVAGFTARFIDLGPEVQRQVIERTQFSEV